MTLVEITIHTRPFVKQRPRISKHGVFYTPSTKKENELRKMIDIEYKGDLIEYNVEIHLVFGFAGGMIGDIDNYEKAVLDCIQGIIIKNDALIKKLCSEIVISNKNYIKIKVDKHDE